MDEAVVLARSVSATLRTDARRPRPEDTRRLHFAAGSHGVLRDAAAVHFTG